MHPAAEEPHGIMQDLNETTKTGCSLGKGQTLSWVGDFPRLLQPYNDSPISPYASSFTLARILIGLRLVVKGFLHLETSEEQGGHTSSTVRLPNADACKTTAA